MSDLDHLRRLLHYDQWANAETLRNLREGAGAPPSAVRWMAHIIGAEFVWLARLREEAPSVPVWPDFDLDEFTLPQELPLSVPSELVRQRPDVLAAEAQLHAATAQVGIATALVGAPFIIALARQRGVTS